LNKGQRPRGKNRLFETVAVGSKGLAGPAIVDAKNKRGEYVRPTNLEDRCDGRKRMVARKDERFQTFFGLAGDQVKKGFSC